MKDVAIQQMRIGAMLLSVLYHSVCYYGVWTGLFHHARQFESIFYWKQLSNLALTVFVFITGLLYAKLYFTKEKYSNRPKMLKDKALRLLVPYSLWAVVGLLLFPSGHILKEFYCGVQHLWFLLMLMVIFAIVIVSGKWAMNIKALIGGLIFFLISYAFIGEYGTRWPNVAAWTFAVRYMPAFICGMLTVRLGIAEKMKHRPVWMQLLTLAAFAFLAFFIGRMPSLPLYRLYVNLPVYCLFICFYVLLSAIHCRWAAASPTRLTVTAWEYISSTTY